MLKLTCGDNAEFLLHLLHGFLDTQTVQINRVSSVVWTGLVGGGGEMEGVMQQGRKAGRQDVGRGERREKKYMENVVSVN